MSNLPSDPGRVVPRIQVEREADARPPRRGIVGLLACGLLLALPVLPALGQENDDCMMCHEDRELTGERDGREISVHVDAEAYGRSVHADADCILCHQELDGAELPHEDELAPVDCALCHEDVAEDQSEGAHHRAAVRGVPNTPSCTSCHGTHEILSPGNPQAPTTRANVPSFCGGCHADQRRALARGEHGKALRAG